MNENIKVSVIIPAFNVDKYIDKCIRSVATQTHKNLELIIVDDGSTDSTGDICDKWARLDDRIVCVHTENRGLSIARNTGMEIATGDYIAFVDSDDFVEISMINTLLEVAKDYNAEIVAAGVSVIDESGQTKRVSNNTGIVSIYDTNDAFKYINCVKFECWNKIYERELISDIRFKAGQRHEDIFFDRKVFFRAKRIAYIETPLYWYLEGRQGATLSSFNRGRLSILEEYPALIRELKENGMHEGMLSVVNCALKHLVQTYWAMCEFDVRDNKNKVVELVKRLYETYGKDIKMSGKERLNYRLFVFFPDCMFFLRRILKGTIKHEPRKIK